MYRARGKYDNAYHKRASKVDKEGNEYGRFANIIGIVADNPRKIRGERCARLFYEESGSQPHLSTGWVQGEALITRGGRRVGSRFAWGCVCAGTKVFKKDGTICNIENLQQSDGIIGFKNGKSNIEPITYMQDEAYKPCVRITTDYGILECSEDHPIYTRIKHSMRSKINYEKRVRYHEYDFIPAKDVMQYANYNAIAICDKIDIWGNVSLFDPYFIGLLIGDGSYGHHKTPVLSNCDDVVNNYVWNKYDTTVERSYITKDQKLYCETRIKGISKLLIDIGIKGQTKMAKRLPNNYEFLTKYDATLLLAGLFDTDGYINQKKNISLTQSNKEILEQCQYLLRKLGIFSKITKILPRIAENRKDKNPYYTLSINDQQSMYNFYLHIPIKIPYKIEALNHLISTFSSCRIDGMRDAHVISVEPIGIQRIYNLTANDSHTYLANDFITHNTGGDSDSKALDGLSKMFNNPDAYNILPYKHNFTEDGETVLTAFFLPAYAMVIDPKYMDHRGYTDMVKAREYFESERKKKSGQVLLDYCAEYCFTGSEALLKQGDSIFDTIAIADRLTQLRVQKIGVKPQVVDLQWDCPNADINPRNKVKMIPNQFGKVKIYEPPIRDDDGNPYKNLYIAGIDSIDQGTGDSSTQSDVSDFCIVIKKRVHGSSMPNYVAIYKDRPKDIVTAYENAMKLLVMYNCKAMLEHTKISIIMHFRSKKMDKLLMQRPKSTLSDIRKGNSTMIGYPATETYLKHGLDLINTFVNESCYSIQIDEMLEQLLKYSWENKRKFDIIAAMIAAELGDEDLMGFTPKVSNAIANEWRDFGWYVDAYGNKRYGIIPK